MTIISVKAMLHRAVLAALRGCMASGMVVLNALTQHFRIGISDNFTDFTDDLTDFDYDHQGRFFDVVGRS